MVDKQTTDIQSSGVSTNKTIYFIAMQTYKELKKLIVAHR
jgi:hypothetical protein